METSRRRGAAQDAYLPALISALQVLDNSEYRRLYKEAVWQRLAGRPESKLVQAALHLLYTRINGRVAAKKELRSCWPITESNQQKEFKNVMHGWVKALVGSSRLPPQTAKYFIPAYQSFGSRTVELLFHLALLALEVELERWYPGALDAAAPGLQEAEASAFEQAEEGVQHRQQAECRRLQETLAVLQRMQQLLVASAERAGKQARHLQPWWATSLAHSDKVQAIQQMAQDAPQFPGEAGLDFSVLEALLPSTTAATAASQEGRQSAGGSSSGASSAAPGEANPASVAKVLGMRLTPSGSVPEAVDCAAESGRVAGDLLHLRALLMEAERALQLKATAPSQPAASSTPCSLLQLLPPPRPRSNPILDALRSSAATDAALPSWDGAPLAEDAGSAVQAARQGVWAAIRSTQPQPRPGSPSEASNAAGHACSSSPAPSKGVLLGLTPVRPEPPSSAAADLDSFSSPTECGGSQWGVTLHEGHAVMQSPTLASMAELAAGSPLLLSPISGKLQSDSATHGGEVALPFSLPPSLPSSLPLTPRLTSPAAASDGAAPGLAHAVQKVLGQGEERGQEQQPQRQGQQQEEQQPDSPAESIASFTIMGGHSSSASGGASVLGSHLGGAQQQQQHARGQRADPPGMSPMASSVVPCTGGQHASSSAGSCNPAAAGGSFGGFGGSGTPAVPQPQQPPSGSGGQEAATPESRAQAAQHRQVCRGSPCLASPSVAAAGTPAPAAVSSRNEENQNCGVQAPSGFSPLRQMDDSPMAGVVVQHASAGQRRRRPLLQQLTTALEDALSSPAASQGSLCFTPPKALSSPPAPGSIFSQRTQTTLQDVSNASSPVAPVLSAGPAQSGDLGGVLQRFEKLKALKQRQG